MKQRHHKLIEERLARELEELARTPPDPKAPRMRRVCGNGKPKGGKRGRKPKTVSLEEEGVGETLWGED
jgi:hypothetical protein